MSNTYFPSQTKSAAPDAETRALKILHERLWHFTSIGMGNCRAAQRVRREIECHAALNSPVLRSTCESGSTHKFSNSPTLNQTPLANQTIEQLTAGLSHLESVGLANSRAAEMNRRELSRRLLIQSALLANANFDSQESRDRRGRWTNDGDAGGSATNNPTQTVPPTPEEIRRAAQTMPWEQFHGTEADYIASHPNDPVYSALRAANDPLPGPPSIRAFTPWEKFTFDLRQLMFRWFPGTRPSGQPSPGQVLGAAAMLLPFGIGPETRLGKLLLGYFTAKTAAEQPAYYQAIKQELQTGNYSDAGRHAVEDALKIGMIGAGIHGAIVGGGPKGSGGGKAPAQPQELRKAPKETEPELTSTDQQKKVTQDEQQENNRPVQTTARTNGAPPAEAAAHLGNYGETIPRLRGDPGEIQRQAAHVQDWAQATGRLKNHTPPTGSKQVPGGEHDVFFDSSAGRVYKRTYPPGTFGFIGVGQSLDTGATPYFYLHRLDLMNQVFGSDIRVEAVTPGDKPCIVTSQPAHEAADPSHPHPSDDEVSDFMRAEGFEPMPGFGDRGWVRKTDGLMALDAYPKNFIRTKEGVVPIDLILQEGSSTLPEK